MKSNIQILQTRIRRMILFFIFGLVISGITAFPIETEINLFDSYFINSVWLQNYLPSIHSFLITVSKGIHETAKNYPFIFYGTDWLAFAHIVIGMAFIGPLRDPVRNIWVIEFGMIACLMVIPLAFICGPIRGIPFIWRIIDCSFGLFGIIPLWFTRKWILELEKFQKV
ncbi:MAG: hypothetical protein IPP60_11755 [Sphingobacteriales bacterium]|nr:hypothetical protein [Sphingobacteriales bacterium]